MYFAKTLSKCLFLLILLKGQYYYYKSLLVASVGEDMEARVHFLTEDKAKLADDIRRYVERIAVDFEQKEKLDIEADIWRSKFLASR